MNYYGYPILLVVGDFGNILIIIIFHGHKYNACSLYLVSSAMANIFYLTVGGLIRIFASSYSTWSLQALIMCKLSYYIPGFFGQVTKTLLVCACIDRYMITSKSVRLRAFSTLKRAKYVTAIVYIAWAIIPIHLLIWATISNGQCTRIGWYVTFQAFYTVFCIAFLPAIIVFIFGFLTYRNMKQLHSRIQPINHDMDTNNNNNSLKKRDRDLLILVLAEAIIYLVTTAPLSIVSLETMITQFVLPIKHLSLIQAEVFATNVAFLCIFVFSAIPFYTYFAVSASFRRDVKRLFVNSYRKLRRLPVDPSTNGTTQTATQRDIHG